MANELIVLSDPHTGIAFGGGGGFGLQLDDELDNGVSNSCATFANKRLSSSEFFKPLSVEVWRLDASLDCGSESGGPFRMGGRGARHHSAGSTNGLQRRSSSNASQTTVLANPPLGRRISAAAVIDHDLEFGDV